MTFSLYQLEKSLDLAGHQLNLHVLSLAYVIEVDEYNQKTASATCGNPMPSFGIPVARWNASPWRQSVMAVARAADGDKAAASVFLEKLRTTQKLCRKSGIATRTQG